jgi:protein-tyrosine sulfotransferase
MRRRNWKDPDRVVSQTVAEQLPRSHEILLLHSLLLAASALPTNCYPSLSLARSLAMNQYERAIQALRFECILLCAVWRSQACLPSKISLFIGLGYLFGPVDLIPNRIPIFGHLDELGFVVGGLVSSRLLVPFQLEHYVIRQSGLANYADRRIQTCAESLPAKVQSELFAQALIFKRRLCRLGAHITSSARRARSQLRGASTHRSLDDFLFTLLGYRLWWCLRSQFARSRSDCRSIIVIGGAARSGTTLLRTILGRHSLIASGPETTVFLRRISSPDIIAERLGWDPVMVEQWQRESRSQVDFIEKVQRAVLNQSGKVIWAEKTPRNVGRFGFVRRRLPHAKLVHIIRDGRDVVCSLRRTPFARLDHAPWDSPDAARRCAVQWRTSVKAGLRFRGDPAYYELRYEDLVGDPEPTLRALLDFLGVPWDHRLLESTSPDSDDLNAAAAGAIFGSSIGRWRRDLSQSDQTALHLLIGPLLVELGYEGGLDWNGNRLTTPNSWEQPQGGVETRMSTASISACSSRRMVRPPAHVQRSANRWPTAS